MGDHNFSDLKEFALGLGGNTTESDNTTSSGLKQTIHVPHIPSTHLSPSVQMETAAAPYNGTGNPLPNLALSLAHILNPTAPNDLCETEGQDMTCAPLDKSSTAEHGNLLLNESSSTAEHIQNLPLPDADGMMVDLPPCDPSLDSIKGPIDDDMQLDDRESQKCDGDPLSLKKSGLLGWLHVGASKKRKLKDADIASLDSNMSDSAKNSSKGQKSMAKKLKTILGAVAGPGMSRAATASRELRQKVQSGEFKPDPTKVKKWAEEIRKIDKNADVNVKTAQDVRHSTCGRWYKTKEPYDTYRFRKHVSEQCSLLPHIAGAGTPTVSQWQQKYNIDVHNTSATQLLQRHLPCPGITENDDTRVTVYLGCTGATGGGA
jgi:hypothetical protein